MIVSILIIQNMVVSLLVLKRGPEVGGFRITVFFVFFFLFLFFYGFYGCITGFWFRTPEGFELRRLTLFFFVLLLLLFF